MMILYENITVFTIFCSNKCSLGEHKSSVRNKQKKSYQIWPAVPGFLVLVYMLSTTLMYAAKLCLMIVMNSSCMPLFSCPQLPFFLSPTVAFTWTLFFQCGLSGAVILLIQKNTFILILMLMLTCLCYLQALTKDSRSKLRVNIPLYFSL